MCNGNGISRVRLDDMSDNARKEKNIYRKMGLEYENKNSNEPEMIGHLQNMFSNIDEYTQGKFNETLHFFEGSDKFLEDPIMNHLLLVQIQVQKYLNLIPKYIKFHTFHQRYSIPFRLSYSETGMSPWIQLQRNFGRDGRGKSLDPQSKSIFRSGSK